MGKDGPWDFNTRAVAERRSWTLDQLVGELDHEVAELQQSA
jgi:hypothetical protein